MDIHREDIEDLIKKCYGEFGLIMDGTPLFAEAECVVVRLVHQESFEIVELVIHLGLYSEALNGEAIAAHIMEALKRYSLDMKKWRTAMMDRASTNKRAMTVIGEEKGIKPLSVYCISHGYSGCGKKHGMTVGRRVNKSLTKMVMHSMCKARTFFTDKFKEAPKKNGGVRWGIELELTEQVNRIGLETLVEEYVKPCAKNKWSEKSAKKVLAHVKDPHDMAKAIVELAAVKDTGTPIISNVYKCETKQPIVFVMSEIIADMNKLYGRGPEHFPGYVELKKKSEEAAKMMTAKEMVRYSAQAFVLLIAL